MGREIKKACLLVFILLCLKCEFLTLVYVLYVCVYIHNTYTQKHIHTFTHYMHTYSQKYILTYSHIHTHKSCAAGAGHLAHPARPISVRVLGGHIPDDLRRALNFPFQANLTKASTQHVPRSSARLPRELEPCWQPCPLSSLPLGLQSVGQSVIIPRAGRAPINPLEFLWVLGAGLGRPGLA